MLRFLPLLWANLKRRRLRLAFTLASIAVAFLLYGLLEALRGAFSMGVDLAGADRLMVVGKVSIIQPLPRAYGNRIAGFRGVKRVSGASWFGGFFQDEKNELPVFPVDAEIYLQIYPEIEIPDAQRQAWLADRGGALAGKPLADRFGWKVGDTIPMQSDIWRKTDGSNVWDLKVDGIFDYPPGTGNEYSVLMHYDYFNEARSYGKDMVGWYILQLEDATAAPQIARDIDAMFSNSSFETRTATEKAFAQQWANQVGNIGAILIAVLTAVFFTMLLVTTNTMAQSVRERTSELGLMKTLGFRDGAVMRLVLAESLFITMLGGLIGLLLAVGTIGLLAPIAQQYLPVFQVPRQSLMIGVVLMLGLGLLAGAWPAAQALRLQIVTALRHS